MADIPLSVLLGWLMREAGGPRPLVHISYTALLGWHHKSAAVNSLTQVAAPPVVLSYLYASSLKNVSVLLHYPLRESRFHFE